MEFADCSKLFPSMDALKCIGNYSLEKTTDAYQILSQRVHEFALNPENAHVIANAKYIAGGTAAVIGVYCIAKSIQDLHKVVFRVAVGVGFVALAVYIVTA